MSTVAELLNRAWAHHQAGRLAQAEPLYREVLQLEPRQFDTLRLLGTLACQTDRFEAGIELLQRAVQVNPADWECHSNLGAALKEMGRLDEVVPCLERAVRLQPNNFTACYNLANAYHAQGRRDDAAHWYRRALQLCPDLVDAVSNLGDVLREQGKLNEAIAQYEQSLRLRPDNFGIHNNLAVALLQQGRVDEAGDRLRATIARYPSQPLPYNTLCTVLLKQGKRAEALEAARAALRLQPDHLLAHSSVLYCLNFDPDADPDVVFEEHRQWGRRHTPPGPIAVHANDPNPERRLRIGYVSPDLRWHALCRYLEPVLAHHDPRQVEVFCYAEVSAPDTMTARFQTLAHHWRWIFGHSAERVCAQVRQDGIDILVDLAGHTGNHRLDVFAHKPAPVQATWLGYMNTTGLETIDYRITDEVLDPPGAPLRDTEQLLRLPGGSSCFARPAEDLAVSPLPALRTGLLTFGSLHPLTKLNDKVFDLWCRVLRALPGSRL